MEKYICDRVDEGIVVLEKSDRGHIRVPVAEFDFAVSEGDTVLFDGEKYIPDNTEKSVRQERLLSLQKKLSEKNKKR